MIRVEQGDCRDVLAALAENSVDSCVTDPPYHLTTGRKGGTGEASVNLKTPAGRARITTGFMGKAWDGGDVAFDPALWRAVWRILKPGGHLLAFGGTRTYHRMACAIEDAGFEIRDQIGWLYGTGFPKSLDVSKAIDKAAGAEREVVGTRTLANDITSGGYLDAKHGKRPPIEAAITVPATDAAREWQGWGTALKPAWEPIVVARKPLIGTVAENVQAHGVGALNIDGCRIGESKRVPGSPRGARSGRIFGAYGAQSGIESGHDPNLGRWPANVIHDGSDEVVAAFPGEAGGGMKNPGDEIGYGDSGSAARFFYSAKASASERAGSKHPTVKPVDLMAYLCRLVTPPRGTVLDPFAGSGTTGVACQREGFDAILIEREEEYVADIRRRLSQADGSDTPLFEGKAP